jgi:F0F1-type ATP synthase membrane subunit a
MNNNNPFTMFSVNNFVFKYFTLNSIHFNLIYVFLLICILALLIKRSNLVHNLLLKLWNTLSNMLDIHHHPENKQHLPFFFTIVLINTITNFFGRLPFFFPVTSLLKVSIPFHMVIFLYFLYASVKKNGINTLKIFFNEHMILPLRIFIGTLEIFSFLLKIIIFSLRVLANITAGHVLMWVIENLIANGSSYFKIFPFLFLVLIYLIEFIGVVLQSYIFMILTTNTFKSVQEAH